MPGGRLTGWVAGTLLSAGGGGGELLGTQGAGRRWWLDMEA